MKFVYLILFLLSFTSTANSALISAYDFYQAGLVPMAPYTFIFNQQGQLIYHHKGIDATFGRAIKLNQPTSDAEVIRSRLNKVISLPEFNKTNFTVIYTLMDGECPPCEKQENLFDETLSKFKNTSFNIVTLVLNTERPK